MAAVASSTLAVASGDARHRDKALMLGATVTRMAVNLLTFVILARYLGPAPFGIVAAAIAYTSFAALFGDFGFALSAMRRAGADPDRAGSLVSESIVAKAVLTAIVTLVGALVVWGVVPADRFAIYGLAHIGAVGGSFADLLLVLSRAKRRYDVEVRVVVTSSALTLLLVGSATALTRNPTIAMVAYAGCRLIYLSLALLCLRRWLPGLGETFAGWHRAGKTLRESASYAVDSILTTASAQIDILLFSALLGAHALGLYQSGARLVQAIMPFAVVLSSVYLPPLSAAAARRDDAAFLRNATRLNLEFAMLAVIAGLGFALVGPAATQFLYGPRFAGLVPLWPGFAAYAALRMLAAGFGIQLAARGQIAARIAAQLSAIVGLCAIAAMGLPALGLAATSSFLAAANVPLLLVLGSTAWWNDRRDKTALLTTIAILVMAAFLVSMGTPSP